MPDIKESSKPDIAFIFLKWLVIILSIIMVSGFLFVVTILGIKIYNFNTTPKSLSEFSNQDIFIHEGKIESIEVENDLLTIFVRVSESHLEVSVIDIKNGTLVNQLTIKQKKSLYNE